MHRKKSSNTLHRNDFIVKLLRELYRGVHAKALSLKDRSTLQRDANDKSLTYGEVVPKSFVQILCASAAQKKNAVFVDLGCGSGVAVLCAALWSDSTFSKVWGIELLPELSAAASSVSTNLQSLLGAARQNQHQRPVTDAPESKVTGTKSSASDTSGCNLISMVQTELENLPARSLNIESLVASLCKTVGHKEYRKLLKNSGHKTFKKFLMAHPDSVLVRGDVVEIFHTNTDPSENDRLCAPSMVEHSCERQACDEQSTVEGIHKSNTEDMNCDDPDMAAKGVSLSEPDVAAEIVGSCESDEVTEVVGSGESDVVMSRDRILGLLMSPGGRYTLSSPMPEICIDTGDIFEINWWEEADIVYCASLLFTDDMMTQLGDRVSRMKPSSYFISLKPLPKGCSNVMLVSDSFYKMSWQMARVYIYRIIAS